MKYALILCLLLASCGTHRKLTPAAPPQSEPIGLDTPPPAPRDKEFVRVNSDNPAENGPSRGNVVVKPNRSLLDKLTGRTRPPVVYPPGTPVYAGKKSNITVNNVTGGQTNTSNTAGKNATAGTGATGGGKSDGPVAGAGGTLTNIEKANAPVGTGTGDVTDNTKAGQRGGAAATGAGATATATTVKPGLPWARIAAGLVGGGFVIWVLFFGGGATLLAVWRRNKSTSNQA